MVEDHGGLLSTIMRPFSAVYGHAIARRNRAFDAGRGVVRLSEPVISVGNLTVGGTGKTPVCKYIVGLLRNAGHNPAIAMRGYRADEQGLSDEAMEYADAFENLPLAVGADRVNALQELRTHSAFDCVVLDDGFQHRRIARDLDIVLVDASRPRLHDHLLPAGRLREPPGALRRADAILVTRSEGVDAALGQQIETHSGRPPVAWLAHAWGDGIDVHQGTASARTVGVDALKGLAVAVSLGVGNPQSVIAMIESHGADIVHLQPAVDHQHYSDASIKTLFANAQRHAADAIIVTPKDWMKLRQHASAFDEGIPVFVPRLGVKVHEGAQRLQEMILGAGTLEA